MLINEPGYWYRRAEEARVLAKQMNNEQNNKMMLKIADAYDELAVKAAVFETTGADAPMWSEKEHVP
jgi:hypothetical protein